MAPPNQKAHELEVRRSYRATPEAIYQAWTSPEILTRWFAPSTEYRVIVHELEVRPGGRYRIEMVHSGGNRHTSHGVYRDLEPGRRIVFSWRWETRDTMPDTVVEIELFPHGDTTELVLRHRLFEEEADRDNHDKGWQGCLEQLAAVLV